MAATKDSDAVVECTVLRGRIMIDDIVYKKGDTVALPAEKVDIHPNGMLARK